MASVFDLLLGDSTTWHGARDVFENGLPSKMGDTHDLAPDPAVVEVEHVLLMETDIATFRVVHPEELSDGELARAGRTNDDKYLAHREVR